MLRKPVESSSIRSVGYDPLTFLLEIEYAGGDVYTYHGVPRTVYEQLLKADSKGRFVTYEIKPYFTYRKLSV